MSQHSFNYRKRIPIDFDHNYKYIMMHEMKSTGIDFEILLANGSTLLDSFRLTSLTLMQRAQVMRMVAIPTSLLKAIQKRNLFCTRLNLSRFFAKSYNDPIFQNRKDQVNIATILALLMRSTLNASTLSSRRPMMLTYILLLFFYSIWLSLVILCLLFDIYFPGVYPTSPVVVLPFTSLSAHSTSYGHRHLLYNS